MITLIMDVVLILFQRRLEKVSPDMDRLFLVSSWSESLKTMGKANFFGSIINYAKDLINAEIIDLMTPYIDYK